MADTVAYVARGRAAGDRRAGRPRPARPAGCPSYPGVWVGLDTRSPARSPPSACASAGAARCTASPSTSTPTWPCSATSCRAASPTRPVTSLRGRGHRRDHARGGRRRRSPAPPSGGGAAGSTGPTSCGASGRPTSPPSPAARAPVRRPARRQPSARSARPRGLGGGRRRGDVGAAAGPAGRGRRDRRAWPSPSASPSGCGPGPSIGADYRPAQAHHARPRPGHRVRGGRLPQHLRVLGRRHRHVHDQRRALHPGVRLLPGRHPPPRAPRPRRAGAGGRGRRADGPGATPWSPPWPATTWPTAAPAAFAATIGPSGRAAPAAPVEVLIPDCKGDPDALAGDLRRPARRPEPQHRDRRPAAAGRAPVGRPTPAAWRCWPGPRRAGPHHQVGPHRRHGRDRRRGASRPWPTCAGVGVDIVTIGQYLRPTTHHLPVARWVDARGVRRRSPRRARPWASATSRPARSPGRATTPARRPKR